MRLRLSYVGWLLVLPLACGDDGVPADSDTTGAETSSGPSSSSTSPSGSSSSTTLPGTDSDTTTDSSSTGGSDSTSLTGVDTSSSSTDTTGPVVTDTSSSSSTTDTTTTDTTTFGEDSTSSGFLVPLDLGPAAECNVWEQDCPMDEKCMAWADDGGNAWNAWRCVPIAASPGQHGDPCTVEGSAVSGIDDCDLGLTCFYVDAVTNVGTCIGYCENEMMPTCADPDSACVILSDGWLPVCLPTCDPFIQDCDDGLGCYAVQNALVCIWDASGGAGAQGDECEYINACDPGLHCASIDNIPECPGESCCTEFCDLDGFMCPDMADCVPYFAPGMEPAGYEDVGFCGVPT